ncbi:MAG: antibiotic biosynthesis monooxygenase [Novosphingobium sp.]|uniref:putative quinol monooxygenase n=1 Tax=Novosphingobium sp. TaxID=1874826 RepID=UPI001846C394|nr:antibiotic biosynthesis monooxygenase [Novosphingobium sp.]
MIIITGSATIRPACIDEALRLGREHSQRSRGEPGCVAHNCHIDAENPHRIVFVEEWADMDAVKAHFAVPESGGFVKAMGRMAVAAPVMTIFNADEISVR